MESRPPIHTSEGDSKVERLKKSSLKTRLITAIIFAAIAIGVISVPGNPGIYVFQAALLVLTIIGTFEMVKLIERNKKIGALPVVVIFVLTAINFLNVAVFQEIFNNIDNAININVIGIKIDYLPLILINIIVLLSLTVFCRSFDSNDAAKAIMTIFYVGFGMTAIMILRLWGTKFVVYAILISSLTDIFAYFIGSMFGKRKMCPNISPKKSWEGAIGGTVCATVIASCFAIFYGNIFPNDTFFNQFNQLTLLDNFPAIMHLHQLTIALIIIPITLIGSIVSQIGDLIASRMKRTNNIKDFGNLFPGHGGVLDRLDSLMFLSLYLVGIFLVFNGLPA